MKNDSIPYEVGSTPSLGRQMLNKVPQITVLFWVIKILTTGMGEVASDYLCRLLHPGIATGIVGICLVISLVLQFSVRRYVTWVYWLNIIMISIFGTMIADGLHIGLIASTTLFAVILAIIFIIWYVSEKTLSIHSIYTRRREAFYWATVMATFALGTALGDLTARTMHLGFLLSGIMFVVIIIIPALAYKLFSLNEIFAFWFAYIITRPLGASFADWMTSSSRRGGLGLSKGSVSLGLTIIIIGFIAYLSITHKDANNSKDLEPHLIST